MSLPDILQQLVTMSRHLGDPALDYVILAEGNSSAWTDEETFWVKASGVNMPGTSLLCWPCWMAPI